nr:hypothetical protein [Escherichia coli]
MKPLHSSMVLAGRAMPVLEADVYELHSSSGNTAIGKKPFGIMFEALDSLKENDVYIATGSSLRYALWGGLMSTRAMHLKAAGAVLDGYVRTLKKFLILISPHLVMVLMLRIRGREEKSLIITSRLKFAVW